MTERKETRCPRCKGMGTKGGIVCAVCSGTGVKGYKPLLDIMEDKPPPDGDRDE